MKKIERLFCLKPASSTKTITIIKKKSYLSLNFIGDIDNPKNINNLMKKLDKSLDRYYDNSELLSNLIPLLTKEAEKPVTVNLPVLPAPDLSGTNSER